MLVDAKPTMVFCTSAAVSLFPQNSNRTKDGSNY